MWHDLPDDRMSLDAQRLVRVAAAVFLLAMIAAGVGSDVGSGSATSPRWLGLAVIVLAAVVVLGGVLVAVSAGAYAAFAGTGSRGKAFILGAGAVLFSAVVTTLWLLRPEYNSWTPSGHGKRCVDGTFFWLHYPARRAELFQDDSGRFCWPSAAGGGAGEAGGGGGDIPGALVAAAGGITALVVVLAVVAAIVARSRRSVSAPVEDEDPVVQALDESLDDLRRERDVRRAIVACYARMERAFAGAGRGRRAHETPLEFLRRVLAQVAREPGQVLTELFERASFSVEPMGESEKRSAIAALEALRARVAG